MTSQQRKRRRGVILTHQGQQKLRAAIAEIEEEENFGQKLTLEELSDRTGLDAGTVAKVLDVEKGCDRRTLERLFQSFGLELIETDYTKPILGSAISEATQNPKPKTQTFVDWGEAVDVSIFYGRTEELNTLENWILQDRCHLVALLGIGGIGKTALSARLSENIQAEFDYLIWRSLREAPPIEKILADCIRFLSNQQETNLSNTVGEAVSRLIHYLQASRCLLVLDNAESILQGGTQAGQYREGYEDYGNMLQRVGESRHQSCLVVTSREKPKEVARLEGRNRPVRSLLLQGLEADVGKEFLKAEGLDDADVQWKQVFDYYGGNPLALKIAANTIQDLFGGNITNFLSQDTGVFGDIRDLLDQQFDRLSDMGKPVMYWLAINRELTSIEELKEDILQPISTQQLMETLESLRRRSLVERSEEGFTLQNVVMEYLTNHFISTITEEINTRKIIFFNSHALIKATAKDYVRETQVRLILQPIKAIFAGKRYFEERLKQILMLLKEASDKSGYAGGNILNLLTNDEPRLSHYDFSNLSVWQSYLQGIELHQINFYSSDLSKSIFTRGFKTVSSIAINPTGTIYAIGDRGGGIRLWRTSDGKQLAVLREHDGFVDIAFSPNGKILASGSHDHVIKLWDMTSYKCICSLQEHTQAVTSVTFSPCGKLLATGSRDQTIKLWNLEHHKCIRTLKGCTDDVWRVRFSPDGQTLAVSGIEEIIELWDVATGKCFKTLKGHFAGVNFISFSPNERILITGSRDETTKLWKLDTGGAFRTIKGENPLAISPDGATLATYESLEIDQVTVHLWNMSTGHLIKAFRESGKWLEGVFSPNSQTLAIADTYCAIRIRDVKTGEKLKTLQGYDNYVSAITFRADSRLLVTGHYDQTVRVWNAMTGKCIHILRGHQDQVNNLAFCQNGQDLMSQSFDKTIKFWNLKSGQYFKNISLESLDLGLFSPDRNFFFQWKQGVGEKGVSIHVWDLQKEELTKIFPADFKRLWIMSISPDDKYLAHLTKNDRAIKIWEIGTGSPSFTLSGHTDSIYCISFNLDKNTIASGSYDRTIRLWSLKTGECINTFCGHTDRVYSIAFSPNRQFIASGGKDKSIRFWEIESGECLNKLEGHTGSINKIHFSSNGQYP